MHVTNSHVHIRLDEDKMSNTIKVIAHLSFSYRKDRKDNMSVQYPIRTSNQHKNQGTWGIEVYVDQGCHNIIALITTLIFKKMK